MSPLHPTVAIRNLSKNPGAHPLVYHNDNAMKQKKAFPRDLLLGALLTAITAGLALCLDYRPAHADLIVCNGSDRDVEFSYGIYVSSNDGWTAYGHYSIDNEDCDAIRNGDLHQTIYYYAQSPYDQDVIYPGSSVTGKASFCVDTLHDYETVWDGDDNIPYYKDLELANPEFDSCEDLGNRYRRTGFGKLELAKDYDHCVILLRDGGTSYRHCFND